MPDGGEKERKLCEMKVLVTGVGGQLGHDVVKELVRRGMETVGKIGRAHV